MSAILELQELARKSSTDIVELVETAYTIAYKLELQNFVDWCNAELEGYFNNPSVPIPEYRRKGELAIFYDNGKLIKKSGQIKNAKKY